MRDAAQRAGLPLDQWLRAQLFGTQALAADTAPGSPGSVADLHRRVQELASQIEQLADRAAPAPIADPTPGRPSPAAYAEAKLEAAIRHINERMSEIGAARPRAFESPAFETPPRRPDLRAADPLASASFGRQLDDILHAPEATTPAHDSAPATADGIEAAVAEIAARQNELDALAAGRGTRDVSIHEPVAAQPAFQQALPREPAAPAPRELPAYPKLPRAPRPELNLERPARAPEAKTPEAPVANEAIAALHHELSQMREALDQLAPRRAVAELQRTVASLAERVERSGAANDDIKATLGALRETIGALRLPEHGAVITGRIDTLARKIDLLNAKSIDASAISRLQAQSSEIRDLLARTLSADSVQRLAEQVALLAGKIADLSGAQETMMRTLVAPLEQRLDRIADRIETHGAKTPAIPVDDIFRRLDAIQLNVASVRREPPTGMEAMFQGLTERLTRIERPAVTPDVATSQQFETLSRQIAALATKLDGINAPATEIAGQISGQITGQLSGIERTLNDLFIQVEETRATMVAGSGPRTPGPSGSGVHTGPAPGAALLKREMATIEASRASAASSAPAARAPSPAPAAAPREAFAPQMMRAALEELVRASAPAAPAPTSPAIIPVAAVPAPQPQAAAAPVAAPAPILAVAQPEVEPEAVTARAAAPEIAPAPPVVAPSPRDFDDGLGSPVDLDALHPAPPVPDAVNDDGAPARVEFIARARRATQGAAPVLPSSHYHIGHRQHGERPTRWLARIRAMLLIGLCGSALAFGSWHLLGAMRQAQLQASGNAPAPAMTARSQPARGQPAMAPGDITGSIGKAATPAPKVAAPAPAPAAPSPAPQPSSMSQPAELPGGIGSPGLRAAALSGDPGAAYEIAHRFMEGNGVPASVTRAAEWFQYAAANGSVPAAYRLGAIYEKGMAEVPRDIARARQLYEQAATGGNVRAMHNLGVLLAAGVDGQPDYRSAAEWFTRAAERGVRDSQYNLAVLYARGFGVTTNLAEAWQWFSLAASSGDNEAAVKRDEVARKMDAKSLDAARASIEGWAPLMVDAKANSGSGIDLDASIPRKTASR